MTELLELPESLSGERLDRALSIVLERSRAEASELLAQGRVRIDGQLVERGHRRVRGGEVLEIDLPPERPVGPGALGASSTVAFEVVYDDPAIIVINKPAGVVVHPGAGHRDDTLVSGLIERYPDLVEAAAQGAGDANRPGIVHRLDKDTSGLLVVARTPEAYRSLTAQLLARTMGRSYVALALGHLAADEGVIEAPIGRSLRDRTRMAVSVSGRAARTHYQVQARYKVPISASLLDVHLETGRTHQIRVHLAAIGHPLAGDTRYGGSARLLSLKRPFLHAAGIELVHPLSGEELRFSVPLPEDLRLVLAELS